MIAALLLGLVKPAVAGPAFPPLTSSDFQNQVAEVESLMNSGDFAAARKSAEFLPKRTFRIGIDLNRVPPESRKSFREAFTRALSEWGVEPIYSSQNPNVKIVFDERLAVDPVLNGPANLTTFSSRSSSAPQLVVHLGLIRGPENRKATPADIFNDVRHAIGLYLGLAPTTLPHYLMCPSAPTDELRTVTLPESRSVRAAFALTNYLKNNIDQHHSVGISRSSKLIYSPQAFEGSGIQGDVMDLPISLTNSGPGTLTINAIGDCGCVVPESGEPVSPGKTGQLKLRLETKEFYGPLERNVILFSNDPNLPMSVIPIHMKLTPRYRFVPENGPTLVTETGGKHFNVYFFTPNDRQFEVTNVQGLGLDGVVVTFAPWSGRLADPELGEGPIDRVGYKLDVFVPDSVPGGRKSLGLAVVTTNNRYPTVYTNVYVQKGIVALPGQLFLGATKSKPKEVTIKISRPGHPFMIKSAQSDNEHIQVKSIELVGLGEYRLLVATDGKLEVGEINSKITVQTDDKAQPEIVVGVTGTVH
jgi:Protein of unknown function (DUF1573)